jgi:hypothetical protein
LSVNVTALSGMVAPDGSLMTPLNELVDWPNAAALARNRNMNVGLSKETPLSSRMFVYETVGRETWREAADRGRSNTGSERVSPIVQREFKLLGMNSHQSF